ncbi:MAG: glycosyl transferase [Rhodospirillales bacterium]|jgi:glycosyltransferase involved in cell wall biosynthesis|nr:glycosyl transferase [Rhodospirillales bacterium]
MDLPLISIVINNHNYAQYLGRAIESALSQHYQRTELIVVDDGSTDDSRKIIARYRERCVTVLQERRGQGGAYNSGFRASRGDIVLFLDSDDVLYPEATAEIARVWSPEVAKVQFPLDIVDAVERPRGGRVPNLPFASSRDTLSMVRSYGYYPSPPASGNAFARRALEHMLPADERVWRIGIDGLVIGLAPLYGLIVSVPRPLGAYREHGRNHSEAGSISLAKLRRCLENETDREAAVKVHAESLGDPIRRELSLHIPGHCKNRILSLRLDPATHPFPGDTVLGLVLAGIRASWSFPHNRFAKSLASSIAFALLPIVPKPWLARNLAPLSVARKRKGWLSRLMPERNVMQQPLEHAYAQPSNLRQLNPGLAQVTRKFLNCQGSAASMSSGKSRPRSSSGVQLP